MWRMQKGAHVHLHLIRVWIMLGLLSGVQRMKITTLIVALNSLQWDIETKKNLKNAEIDFYGDVLSDVQEILNNIDQ